MKNNKIVFAFQRENYMLILAGLIVLILGFFLMSGGGSEDPNEFLGTYSLTEESFDKMAIHYGDDTSVTSKLQSLKDKEFPSEQELKIAIEGQIGKGKMQANYFTTKAATNIDAAIFSTTRITIAPIVILLGYILVLIGIMRKPKNVQLVETNTQLAD